MSDIITTPDKIYSEDGLELDSVIFEPKRNTGKAIIHIHGITGHYLQNHFISHMSRKYCKNGYAFLSFNNRGHDYIADVVKTSMTGVDRVQKGSAFDILEECVMDIRPVVNYLLALGYKEIILQGHSLGVLKACYYLSTIRNHNISKVILISPMDVIHLLNTQVKDWKYWRDVAKTMIAGGRGNHFTGTKIWLDVPICAESFWNYTREDSNMWMFNFTNPEKEFIHFQNLSLPLLNVIPQNDMYAEGVEAVKAKVLLEKKLPKKINNSVIIPKAGHGYWGQENILVEAILNWLIKA